MKKAYIIPSVEVIKMDTQSSLLTTSPLEGITISDDDVNADSGFGREDNTISSPDLWDQVW